MKPMKKTVSILLTLVLLAGLVPLADMAKIDFSALFPKAGAAEIVKTGFCGHDVTYTLDSEGLLTIAGTGDMYDYSSVVAPYTANGSEDSILRVNILPGVTSVGDRAFWNCRKLTDVSIAGSVRSVGYQAFGSCGLTEISIPDGVTSIGDSAFEFCSSLKKITFPDSLISIGTDAFFESGWYKEQPEGMVYAGRVAYRYKGKMPDQTALMIKNGTTGIADSALSYCGGLTEISIPDTVVSIGEGAFSGCEHLTEITIPGSVTSIGGSAFLNCISLGEITIPDSVTSIGYHAFENTAWLNALPDGLICAGKVAYCYKGTMPDQKKLSLSSDTLGIAELAFSGQKGLVSLTIPAGVVSVGPGMVAGCGGLKELTVKKGNPKFHSAGNCVIETESKTLVAGCQTSVIPGDGTVTAIGKQAFEKCAGLAQIEIPDTVRFIGKRAFCECTGLKSIAIPDGIREINSQTFQLSGLESVILPDSIVMINAHAFGARSSLKYVYYTGSTDQWSAIEVYYDNQSLLQADVRCDTVSATVEYSSTKDGNHILDRKELFSFDCFNKSSSVFQTQLAKMSMALAMNAFTKTKDEKDGSGKVKKGDQYIRKLLINLGCDSDSIVTSKFNDYTSTKDTCAYAIAKKQLSGDGGYLLIVPVRGIGYGDGFNGEWLSNFRVYHPDYPSYAYGFKAAADKVFDRLKEYIAADDQLTYDNVKIWVTGFSRAGAVSNLLAARLADDTGIGSEDIFAYTFATPATVMTTSDAGKDYGADRYGGIHNIIQAVDAVPRVPLRQWKFWRYGVTYALPCWATAGSSYSRLLSRMVSAFGTLGDGADYRILPYQEQVLELATKYLSEVVPSAQAYGTDGMQGLLVDVLMGGDESWIVNFCNLVFGSDAGRVLEVSRSFSGYSVTEKIKAIGDLVSIIRKALTTRQFSLAADYASAAFNILNIILEVLCNISAKIIDTQLELSAEEREKNLEYFFTHDTDYLLLCCIGDIISNGLEKANLTYLFYQHWPEVYCAWLSFADAGGVLTPMTGTTSYSRTTVKCPVDISVYDRSNTLVGRIVNDRVDETIEDAVCCRSDVRTGEKELCLPAGQTYRVEILPREEGAMEIVNEYVAGDSAVNKTEAYYDLDLQQDVAYTAWVNAKWESSTVRTQGEIIPADLITDEEILYTVTAEASEGGVVSGGGTRRAGETAQLSAMALKGYEFDGWYQNGEKVTDRLLYAFTVRADAALQAKFVKSETSDVLPGDVDGNGKVTAGDARKALRIAANLTEATEAELLAADLDGSGKVTAGEARKILRYSAKLIDTLA